MTIIASQVPNFPTEVVDVVWTDFLDRWGEGVDICTLNQEDVNRQPRVFIKKQGLRPLLTPDSARIFQAFP